MPGRPKSLCFDHFVLFLPSQPLFFVGSLLVKDMTHGIKRVLGHAKSGWVKFAGTHDRQQVRQFLLTPFKGAQQGIGETNEPLLKDAHRQTCGGAV